MKDYLLNKSDYNVFAIDWSKGAKTINYLKAAADTRTVGPLVADFIKKLANLTGASPSTMHCVGHSLGAHICGFVGKNIKSPKLAQISGLDPAGPGFSKNVTRLHQTDASLVTVIHTSAGFLTTEGYVPIELRGFLGTTDHLGDFDFWPNGGTKQPGCESLNMSTSNVKRCCIYAQC